MYSTYFFFRISIHAPREGGDTDYKPMAEGYSKFQSTPPARGATLLCVSINHKMRFQSTPPARGATTGAPYVADRLYISIHAPREGGDK